MIGVKAILTMDMSTLCRWLGLGWSWWMRELRATLPSAMGGRRSPRAIPVAEFNGGRLVFREYRPGNGVPIPRTGRPEELMPQMVLALPPSAVLLHDLVLPVLPLAELRHLIAEEMDRLAPLRNEDVVFDLEMGEAMSGNRRRVTIAIVHHKTLQELLETLQARGVGEPRAISLVDTQDGTTRFDLLKAMRMTQEGVPAISPRTGWWIAVLLLAAINIALLTMRDISEVNSLQEQVDAQKLSVTLATIMRHRVEEETKSRRLLVSRRAAQTPLPLLAAVTHALPDGAYVQRFEWNGAVLRLVGQVQPNQDPAALLRNSGAFRDVSETTPGRRTTAGSFDLTLLPQAGHRR